VIPRPPRPLRLLALGLGLALVLAACGSSGPETAAQVDGEVITTERLAADAEMFAFLTGLSGSPCGQPAEGETQTSACNRLTLANLIQEGLVKAYAAEHGVEADPKAVTDAISQVEAAVGGPQALDTELAGAGLTREALVALAERLLLFNAVQEAIAAEAVTDEQVREIYEQDSASYTTVEVAHILVDSRAKAEEVAAEATPKGFAELAAKWSTDQASAANGGSLGKTVESAFRARFDPTFVEAALALQPGEISEPVRTGFGWHVIHLISRELVPLATVRDQIVMQAGVQAFSDWMRERLRTAEISVNPRYGTFDPETGEVLPVRSTDAGASGAAGPTAGAGSPTGP
jgi:foldase protein PrsA